MAGGLVNSATEYLYHSHITTTSNIKAMAPLLLKISSKTVFSVTLFLPLWPHLSLWETYLLKKQTQNSFGHILTAYQHIEIIPILTDYFPNTTFYPPNIERSSYVPASRLDFILTTEPSRISFGKKLGLWNLHLQFPPYHLQSQPTAWGLKDLKIKSSILPAARWPLCSSTFTWPSSRKMTTAMFSAQKPWIIAPF